MCLLQLQEMTNRIGNVISGSHFLGERAEQISKKGSQCAETYALYNRQQRIAAINSMTDWRI